MGCTFEFDRKINTSNKMVHRKGIIHCSCTNTLYPVQAIQ